MATWLIALALAAPGWQEAPPPHLELKDGDRVAVFGDALAESMQEDGELELLLTARFPEANVRFRNLAFAGDTVWGDALAAFDTVEDGYKRRLELARKVEPTVVFLAFGANESWEGEEGLGRFLKGYERLLDDLKAIGPREVVLLAPLPQENLGPPFPDPSAHNVDVARYTEAIRSLAARRGLRFAETAPGPASNSIPAYPLTDDGLHPTAEGHRKIARAVLAGLGLGTTEPLEGARAEELRKVINRKNRLFFDQVRPQNNVYLFGFRKHEQGNNAAEIAQFDALIAEQEAEIARLRGPEAGTPRQTEEVKP